jgi:hypothetical protein
MAFAKVCNWEAALRDFAAIPGGPTNPQGLRTKGRCLYHLSRFMESCRPFATLLKNHPGHDDVHDDLGEAIMRLREQRKCMFDFKEMQTAVSKTDPPILKYTTWVGPVEARQTELQGRGLFVKQDVKPGDLLFVEKAFVYAIEDRDQAKWRNTLHINLETTEVCRGGPIELATLTLQKLYRHPSLIPEIHKLHTNEVPTLIHPDADGKPVLNMLSPNTTHPQPFIHNYPQSKLTTTPTAST